MNPKTKFILACVLAVFVVWNALALLTVGCCSVGKVTLGTFAEAYLGTGILLGIFASIYVIGRFLISSYADYENWKSEREEHEKQSRRRGRWLAKEESEDDNVQTK